MRIVKDIHFGNEGREKLKSGIKKMTDAVGSTMGPMGRTVLIESENHVGGITTTKDGVTVAKSINLYCPVEDLAVTMMREASEKTASSAGDGTTTAIVLAEAMISTAENCIDPNANNRVEVTREMSNIASKIAERLTEDDSVPVEGDTLYNVASVSANNDPELGSMIAEAYNSIGEDGVVTVQNSKTTSTYSTVTSGIHFNRGLMSRFQCTNLQKHISELEKVRVLITDLEIPSFKTLSGLIGEVVQRQESLLIIGEASAEFMSTLNANVYKGNVKAVQVLPPNFGYRREELMEDLAIATGAKYISEKTGSDFGLVTYDDLGYADRVLVDKEGTSIIYDSDVKSDAVEKRIEDIKTSMTEDISDENIEFLEERLALINGAVATIHVGGKTDIEQKEKKDRVDDAVLATKAALEMGILPGGGIALIDVLDDMEVTDTTDGLTARLIMESALKAPFNQIMINAGINPEDLLSDESMNIGLGVGYNPKTKEHGNMIKMGIIDPTKVTVNALLNATSVATTILMTSSIITNIRQEK